LLDARPTYLESDTKPTSLLLAPLGTGSVLDALRRQLEAAEILQTVVIPDFTPHEAYERALRALAADVRIVLPGSLGQFLEACELADHLLLVDVRAMPVSGWPLERLVRERTDWHVVRHIVDMGGLGARSMENVEYDRHLRLRAVHRLYLGVTRLALSKVVCSLLPVAVARTLGPDDVTRLSQVRARLVSAGVPSFDDPQPEPVVDLATPEGLLRANELALGAAERRAAWSGFCRHAPGIWIGPGATVHPTARLFGPLVIHALATVDRDVALIGPTVVGAGSRIGEAATVARSVLWPGARLPPRGTFVRQVLVSSGVGGDGRVAGDGDGADWLPLPGVIGIGTRRNHRNNRHRLYRPIKRALDLLITIPGLVVLAPLLAVVAALIKLTSRGPVLFGHEREGLNGRPFRCWKFRTMVHHAHRQQRELYARNLLDGPQFKLAHDERITPLGHVLRRTNIDELPQLFNVLRGEMSLIGPRPSPFRENQICVPWRQARLSVRPGITGLWQVCRRDREAGDFHQWIYYDLLYVRHQSLWLDLRILLATLITLAGRWPVPLRWMIPARRLAEYESALGSLLAAAPAPAAESQVGVAATPQRTALSVADKGSATRGMDGSGGRVEKAAGYSVPLG